MAREADDDGHARREEAERYRLAAEEALNQIDWCVKYLYRIRKDRIAQAVDRNRTVIRREMSR
jgi:hypothetical protein